MLLYTLACMYSYLGISSKTGILAELRQYVDRFSLVLFIFEKDLHGDHLTLLNWVRRAPFGNHGHQVMERCELCHQVLHQVVNCIVSNCLGIFCGGQYVVHCETCPALLWLCVIPVNLPIWEVLDPHCQSCRGIEHFGVFICVYR